MRTTTPSTTGVNIPTTTHLQRPALHRIGQFFRATLLQLSVLLFRLYRHSPYWVRRWMVVAWQTVPARGTASVRVGDYEMVVNLSDNAAFKYLADKEQYERDLLDTVLRLMVANESTLFIDVGANYGPFSLAAAHSWRGDTRRRVVAFEPDARPFAALMQSVRVNGFDP